MNNIRDLDPTRYVIADPETGTVISTSALLIPVPDNFHELFDSAVEMAAYTISHGTPLFTPTNPAN